MRTIVNVLFYVLSMIVSYVLGELTMYIFVRDKLKEYEKKQETPFSRYFSGKYHNFREKPDYSSLLKQERKWYGVGPKASDNMIYARYDGALGKYYDIAAYITKIDETKWQWILIDDGIVLSTNETFSSKKARQLVEKQISDWKKEQE